MAMTRERLSLPQQRFALLSLILLLWLAFALRVYRLDGQSLWYDEGVTADVASMGLARLTQWTADDIQPPLYYYLEAGWTRLAGRGEWALRFPSAWFGVLTLPLLYVMGCRLLGRRAGALAVLLGATNPLYVYYSQEARMYSLLTWLGLLAGYLLLCALRAASQRQADWFWLAFALAATALLYTHYFAFFLLFAYTLYLFPAYLQQSLTSGFCSRLWRPFLAGIVIFLAYLPWLPAMFTRYQVDASFWGGRLKLGEALRHVIINFTLGAPEMVLEPVAVRLAGGYGVVLLVALAALVWHLRKVQFLSLLFLLLYLLIPLFTILVLASRTPKFHPRYLMLASPAYLLLLASGLMALFGRTGVSRLQTDRATESDSVNASSALAYWLRQVVGVLFLTYMLVASAYAIRNWFTDPRFTKADFRGAAAYVRKHIAPDETIILTSGHMAPVWDYYVPQLERYRIPDIDILDVNAVLGYHTATDLNRALAGRRGVWVVLWQDEVVDPNGYLLDFLRRAGIEQPVKRSFWHVRLHHFRLPPDIHFRSDPPIAHPTSINFGGRLALVGYSGPSEQGTGREEITLFWQALQPLGQDYRIRLELQDQAGNVWGRLPDRRPAAYLYPTTRWQVGQVVFGRYPLPVDAGTPPGNYALAILVYGEDDPAGLDVLDESGAPQGKVALLTPLVVPDLIPVSEVNRLDVGHAIGALLAPEIVLLGVDWDLVSGRPGDPWHLGLWWQTTRAPVSDYLVQVSWSDESGGREPGPIVSPGGNSFPTHRWPGRAVVHTQINGAIPAAAVPGRWSLLVQLVDSTGTPIGPEQVVGTVQVEGEARLWKVPPMELESGANFGGQITLLGIKREQATALPGSTVTITVAWQARRTPARAYTGFVHLLDDADHVRAQDDHPAGGELLSSGWISDQVVLDVYQLTLPDDLPPGMYRLEIGLYDANVPGMPRLSVLDGEQRVVGDSVLLGTLTVR
ncbi:MAG TPA: hypothetical protein EYH31_12930 [Anaerolineae bacterium]|nr:hypothetical protein [Anaerolineae bacterium]